MVGGDNAWFGELSRDMGYQGRNCWRRVGEFLVLEIRYPRIGSPFFVRGW